jgi:hypothetical protein
LSTEVRAWLDHACGTIPELDPVEAGTHKVRAQFLHDDVRRHGAEIVEALHRV